MHLSSRDGFSTLIGRRDGPLVGSFCDAINLFGPIIFDPQKETEMTL
jgi:hypothetical protein